MLPFGKLTDVLVRGKEVENNAKLQQTCCAAPVSSSHGLGLGEKEAIRATC